jgi:hypothetical protein
MNAGWQSFTVTVIRPLWMVYLANLLRDRSSGCFFANSSSEDHIQDLINRDAILVHSFDQMGAKRDRLRKHIAPNLL